MIEAMCLGRVKIDEVAQAVSGFTAVLVLLLSHVQQKLLTSQANLGLPIEKPWIFCSFPYLIPFLRLIPSLDFSDVPLPSLLLAFPSSLEKLLLCFYCAFVVLYVYPSLDVSRGHSALSSHIKDY